MPRLDSALSHGPSQYLADGPVTGTHCRVPGVLARSPSRTEPERRPASLWACRRSRYHDAVMCQFAGDSSSASACPGQCLSRYYPEPGVTACRGHCSSRSLRAGPGVPRPGPVCGRRARVSSRRLGCCRGAPWRPAVAGRRAPAAGPGRAGPPPQQGPLSLRVGKRKRWWHRRCPAGRQCARAGRTDGAAPYAAAASHPSQGITCRPGRGRESPCGQAMAGGGRARPGGATGAPLGPGRGQSPPGLPLAGHRRRDAITW
jgi:hypothetical protein